MKELIDSASDKSSDQRTKLIDLLDDFRDVIPRSLPSRLPPLRKVNHDIALEEGSVPPSRPFYSYRLSKPELDEVQQHPVAYASRKLTSAERNYTIAERNTRCRFCSSNLEVMLIQTFQHLYGQSGSDISSLEASS